MADLDKTPFTELPPPKYSEEECKRVIRYFINLKSESIREFFASHEIPTSGTKDKFRKRVEQYIDDGILKYHDLVNFLDKVVPWGKQHVFFYNGLESEVEKWRNKEYVNGILEKNGLSKYLNARLPLILPETVTLSSIEYIAGRELNIYAVERREHWERKQEHDEKRKTPEKEELELRAYLHQITRGIIIFRWNLVVNTAILQISQLPSGSRYEKVEERFAELITSWLNLGLFRKLDLRLIIRKLHELEETSPEARSHSIGYQTLGGRVVSAQSPSSRDSVLGEPLVDNALSTIRKQGVGHNGNFYWLPSSINPANGNPLAKEVHTIIVGTKGRINFTTPNREEDIKYVLSRVRTLSK